jgi:transcriptional regulator with PAS, ATPase and Fis domain
MIGASTALKKIVQAMTDVARHSSSTVLITGESGTGKELVARSIHHLSPRKEAPFVSINCASMPVNLLESELFGHEKGAFTDAGSRRTGLFEEANMGTIFLDEIGEMDPAVQSKLLRVLEERQIRRVGGTRNIDIDVRVIAATNRNLLMAMKAGRFREDLFYRLNVFPLHIAPLRERQEDIPLLARYYLEKYNKNFSRNYQSIAPDALDALVRYTWPGNVRELKNVIERICIMHDGPVLLPEYLPHELLALSLGTEDMPAGLELQLGGKGLDEMLGDIEQTLVRQALDKSGGNVQMAARILKIPRGTLRYKLEKFGLGRGTGAENQT